jgi:hypothetical protein
VETLFPRDIVAFVAFRFRVIRMHKDYNIVCPQYFQQAQPRQKTKTMMNTTTIVSMELAAKKCQESGHGRTHVLHIVSISGSMQKNTNKSEKQKTDTGGTEAINKQTGSHHIYKKYYIIFRICFSGKSL